MTSTWKPAPKGNEDLLVEKLTKMLQDANTKIGKDLFSLDASRHRLPNKFACSEQVTSEIIEHLDRQLLNCVQKLITHSNLLPGGITVYLHPPVFTCEQATTLCQPSESIELKNLFMTDKKKVHRFLMTACAETKTSFKDIAKAIVESGGVKPKRGLTFAKDLTEKLQLLPGSVTPFGLLNDIQNNVMFYVDQRIFGKTTKYEYVSCHPNACNSSIRIHRKDLLKFIEVATNHRVTIIPMDGGESLGLKAEHFK